MNQTKKKKDSPITEKNVKSLRVAILCISAVIIFFLGANFLKGIESFKKKTYYYAIFEHTGGLVDGSSVQLNGYKIGKMTKTKLVAVDPVKLVVELVINEDIVIPSDSKLEVVQTDILGGIAMNLVMGHSPVPAKNRDTLQAYVVPPMTAGLENVVSRLESILTSVDTIGLSFKDIFHTEKGAANLKNSLENLETSTENLSGILAENKDNLKRLVDDLTLFSATLKNASPQFQNIIANVDEIADTIARANIAYVLNQVTQAVAELNSTIAKLNKGDGNVSRLLNDESLYQNLDSATENLNLLIKDIKENPKRYVTISVFGGKTKEERQKEKEIKKTKKEAL